MSDITESDGGTAELKQGLQELAQALSLLMDRIDAMDKMYDALNAHVDTIEKVVNDDLIGGLTKLYDDNDREMGIRDLQDKYGSEISPYDERIKKLNPEFDTWGSLHKSLSELKGQDGYTDEMGDAHIKSLISGLGDRFPEVAGAKPVAAVEVKKIEENPAEEKEEAEEEKPGEKPAVSEKQRRLMGIAEKLGSRVK